MTPASEPEVNLTDHGFYIGADLATPTDVDTSCYLHPDGVWRDVTYYYASERAARVVLERWRESLR